MNENGKEYWEKGYKKLAWYRRKNGTMEVPGNYVTRDGFKLGAWVVSQRIKKKRGVLTEDQVNRLDELGFVWDWRKENWENGYRHLEEYYSEYGDAEVPKNYISPDGYLLGVWIRRQRFRFGKDAGNQKKLTEEQVEKLNRLGMRWPGQDMEAEADE